MQDGGKQPFQHRGALSRHRVAQRRLDCIVAEGMCRKVREFALKQRGDGGRDVHRCGGCLMEHLLDNAHTMLLRAKRIDVLGHLGDNECGVRVLEGDTDAPRAVRVERTLEHVSIELIDERATLGRWKLRDSRLHHARTLRVLEELDYVTAQSGVDGVVGLCTRGKLGDDIVAKGMGCKLEQVWCQFIAGALELRVRHAHKLLLKQAGLLLFSRTHH
mmetsp:Transcript_13530/g.41076  ORF Transcript_13530/g.41076 Transcript_13530/m.41076 type:complete len:217 (+) Transcript_13530:941-1591(+)